MIPLSQIFKWAAPEQPVVRGPIRGAKKRSRRNFSEKRKKKNRKAARRIRTRSGLPITPAFSSQLQFRRRSNAKRVLALLGIFLLLAVGKLNQRHEILPSAENAPLLHYPETPNQLPWPGVSPNIAMLKSQRHGKELASNTPATTSEMRAELKQRLPVSGNFKLRGLPNVLSTKLSLISSEQSSGQISSPLAPKNGLRWKRLALIQTGSLGLTVAGFRKFDQYFGGSQRPFRVGNDWSKDRTMHFDELIHFQGGYRIAQGLIGLYRWSGMNATWSECLGAGTAATVMTLLEYVDGRRPKPKQGASYSDFTANLLGVGFALAKMHVNVLEDFDLRLNYISFGDVLHKRTLLQYDRMTHWLTYSMERQLGVPLNLGVGYGVQNAFKRNVRSEVYLGLGFTPVDILTRYAPSAAKPLSWLGMYHVGWQVQIK